MPILKTIARKAELIRFAIGTTKSLAEIFAGGSSGGNTKTGKLISKQTAVALAILYACERIKSETFASLNCELFKVTEEGGRKKLERAKSKPLYRVLRYKPNNHQTPFEYFTQMVIDLDLDGNHYSLIERDSSNRIKALYPLDPGAVEPFWVDEPYEIAYRYTPSNLGEGKKEERDRNFRVLMPGEILHVRNLPFATVGRTGYNYLRGAGLLEAQRETLGLSLEARDFASELFNNMATPAGILSFKKNISPETQKKLKKQWDDAHGKDKRGGTAVLGIDSSYQPISMKPVDAQFHESRTSADSDIPRVTGVPPFMVGLPSQTTYANTEQQVRAFHSVTIGQLAQRISKALERDCLSEDDIGNYEIRFDMSELLRGDIEASTKYYAAAIRNGWLNANEIRELEGRNPRKGGNTYNVPPGGAQDQGSAKAISNKNNESEDKPQQTENDGVQ